MLTHTYPHTLRKIKWMCTITTSLWVWLDVWSGDLQAFRKSMVICDSKMSLLRSGIIKPHKTQTLELWLWRDYVDVFLPYYSSQMPELSCEFVDDHYKLMWLPVCVSVNTVHCGCRETLWKFFYPADYHEMEVTELPEAGQLRIWKSFDFKMSMQANSTFDVLFTKNKVSYCWIWMNTLTQSILTITQRESVGLAACPRLRPWPQVHRVRNWTPDL